MPSRSAVAYLGVVLAALEIGGFTAEASDYHPSQVRIDVPGIKIAEPPAFQMVVASKPFWMFPSVIQPTVETAQFIQYMTVKPGERVMDIGTGSGVLAIIAAENASQVIATDIDPTAVENTHYNARFHGVEDTVDARLGDLFAPVGSHEKFDVVLFNVASPLDERTGDPDPLFWLLHERFLAEVGDYLLPGGRIYYHSAFLDNVSRTREVVERYGLKIVEMHMWTARKRNAEPMLYVLRAK